MNIIKEFYIDVYAINSSLKLPTISSSVSSPVASRGSEDSGIGRVPIQTSRQQ